MQNLLGPLEPLRAAKPSYGTDDVPVTNCKVELGVIHNVRGFSSLLIELNYKFILAGFFLNVGDIGGKTLWDL